MDAGSSSSPSYNDESSRYPPQHQFHPRRKPRENWDRFIPNRSAMDMDYARYLLTERSKESKENNSTASVAYRKLLAESLGIDINRNRILVFNNKRPTRADAFPAEFSTTQSPKREKPRRFIPNNSERTLDAPDLIDDYLLNILDWGSNNVICIALRNIVYLWDANNGETTELVTVDEEIGPVTSVKWAPDGQQIAIGLNNSHVQLWDYNANRQLRTFQGGHQSRVGSLDWNDHILTTGGMDGQIINNDVRVRDHIVENYIGHQLEVCSLKWTASGRQLASGGNDNLVYIWDKSMASSRTTNQWLHRLDEHNDTVKALSWCPFQSNLLASGGGINDRCIKFWNTNNIGACLNSIDTGSQVCSLLWNKHERELLSSHSYPDDQLTLYKYPSLVKIADLTGHSSRVLHMAQSPDGCTVASASADETIRIWNVFGSPQVTKTSTKTFNEPFPYLNRIR